MSCTAQSLAHCNEREDPLASRGVKTRPEAASESGAGAHRTARLHEFERVANRFMARAGHRLDRDAAHDLQRGTNEAQEERVEFCRARIIERR
jgi:hypothetical protein